MNDKEMWNIGEHGLPKEYTACPGCGFQYGHHKTKVCMSCEECSKCCRCKEPDHQPSSVIIDQIIHGQ